MGFLSNLFKKDPQAELAKLEAMISRGDDAEKAHQLALKLSDCDQPQVRERARALAGTLASKLVAEYCANAERSIAGKNFDDATDWLTAALPFAVADQRAEIERQIEALALKAHQSDDLPTIGRGGHAGAGEPESEQEELDDEMHFEMLIGMLTEEVAEAYRSLPTAFHGAFLDFNNGRLTEALEVYEQLAPGGNPYVAFEMGRCLLQLGRLEDAVAQLESVQERLGDKALDEAGALSLPMVWAEAKLRLGHSEDVAARLEPLADPRHGADGLLILYARALQDAERLQDAKKFLTLAYKAHVESPMYCVLLAQVVAMMGDFEAAVDLLEKRIDAGRRYTSGSGISPHPAPVRALVALYLQETKTIAKAGEQLLQLEQLVKGQLTREDWLLTARYYELMGDNENAAFAAEAAESAEQAQAQAAFQTLRAGDQAVL